MLGAQWPEAINTWNIFTQFFSSGLHVLQVWAGKSHQSKQINFIHEAFLTSQMIQSDLQIKETKKRGWQEETGQRKNEVKWGESDQNRFKLKMIRDVSETKVTELNFPFRHDNNSNNGNTWSNLQQLPSSLLTFQERKFWPGCVKRRMDKSVYNVTRKRKVGLNRWQIFHQQSNLNTSNVPRWIRT